MIPLVAAFLILVLKTDANLMHRVGLVLILARSPRPELLACFGIDYKEFVPSLGECTRYSLVYSSLHIFSLTDESFDLTDVSWLFHDPILRPAA